MRRAALTLVAVAGLVAGCGDGSGGLPDAPLMVRNAAAAIEAVESARVELTVSGEIAGLPIRSMGAAVTRDGPVAEGTATLVDGRSFDFVDWRGTMYVAGPGGSLTPAPVGVASPAGLLNPAGGVGELLGSLEDPTTVAKESLDGVPAFKIVGEVPKDVVGRIFPGVTTDGQFAVWLRVRWPHVALRTNLTVGGGTVAIDMSDVNKPVSITPPEER